MRYRQIYLALVFAFLIGNHKGFIALWTDPAGEPAIIFPYSVASLPQKDQQLLEKRNHPRIKNRPEPAAGGLSVLR